MFNNKCVCVCACCCRLPLLLLCCCRCVLVAHFALLWLSCCHSRCIVVLVASPCLLSLRSCCFSIAYCCCFTLHCSCCLALHCCSSCHHEMLLSRQTNSQRSPDEEDIEGNDPAVIKYVYPEPISVNPTAAPRFYQPCPTQTHYEVDFRFLSNVTPCNRDEHGHRIVCVCIHTYIHTIIRSNIGMNNTGRFVKCQ